jgi:hypothetical protein
MKLTSKNYWQEIKDSALSPRAQQILIEAIVSRDKNLIPPMVNSDQEFNLIKMEIGSIFIDAKEFNLVKQPMDDNQSYRVRIEPVAE